MYSYFTKIPSSALFVNRTKAKDINALIILYKRYSSRVVISHIMRTNRSAEPMYPLKYQRIGYGVS